ncbi:sulfotransferase [Gracilibacillus lacisalsi]|uniref:sulfotransferase n=1 Tax=Gracilibacillus lacisalsi TaxID=393087 RepID=UPI00036B8708|nr:sulfotransferase [Gracilibacillus lacisalsi]
MRYVILGMHKSGTTLVSRILHKSNLNMGVFDESIDYDSGNQFEREEFNVINKEILRCGRKSSLLVTKKVKSNKIDGKIYEKAYSAVQNLDIKYTDWGFKDPRTCLTYTFWKQIISDHKLIVVVRDPHEVWLHYMKKGKKRNKLAQLAIAILALRAWYIYNKHVLEIIKNNNNEILIIDYTNLMSSRGEFDKLSEFVNMKLIDCRDNSYYRSKKNKSTLYNRILLLCKQFLNIDISKVYKDILHYSNR